MNMRDRSVGDRALAYVGMLLGIGIVYGLLYRLGDVLVPPIVGLLLAYLVDPWVRCYERYCKHRGVAVVGVLLSMGVVATLACVVTGPVIENEIRAFRQVLVDATQPDSPLRQKLHDQIPPALAKRIAQLGDDPSLIEFFQQHENIQDLALSGLRKILPGLWGILSGVMNILALTLAAVLSLVYFVLFAMDLGTWRSTWPRLLPASVRTMVTHVVNDFDDAMSRYFRGQVIVASISSILLAVGFAFLGLRMAVLLGFFAGMLGIVPYLQLASVPFATLLAVVSAVDDGRNVGVMLISVIAVYLVVQLIQDWIVSPRVMGKMTGLPPAVMILSVFVWGRLLGLVGVCLAIPLTCLALAYYKRWLHHVNTPL